MRCCCLACFSAVTHPGAHVGRRKHDCAPTQIVRKKIGEGETKIAVIVITKPEGECSHLYVRLGARSDLGGAIFIRTLKNRFYMRPRAVGVQLGSTNGGNWEGKLTIIHNEEIKNSMPGSPRTCAARNSAAWASESVAMCSVCRRQGLGPPSIPRLKQPPPLLHHRPPFCL